jgi:nucleoside-diphosphate-sugar epimerase
MAQPANSKVLVTGATGFVGSNLVEALLRDGFSVTCLVRNTSDTRTLRQLPVQLAVGDLENPGSLRTSISGIHTVYHVAGAIKAANREQYLRVNQEGTRRLLEIMAEVNPDLSRFIHVSSLAAAGPSPDDRGLREEETPNPISWYGESKLRSEQEVLKYADAFRVTILRPSAVYGPRDRETLMIFRMIRQGCLFTPGRFIRHFSLIHVDDLVDALVHAGKQDTRSGGVFFISRPESYTWEQVGRAIASELGKKYRCVAFPQSIALAAGLAGDLWAKLSNRAATINSQKVKELLQPSWICNTSNARSKLEFIPKTDLETGIRKTVRWYQAEGWL